MNKPEGKSLNPILVLFAICFFAALLLSFTVNITHPIIEEAKKNAFSELGFPGMPELSDFLEYDVEKLPHGVLEAFVTEDKSYFVFKTDTKGYNGHVAFYVGLDGDGNYIGIKMKENSETPGLGSKVAADEYLAGFLGQKDPHAVDTITGVTLTTNSLRSALILASQSYDIIKGE